MNYQQQTVILKIFLNSLKTIAICASRIRTAAQNDWKSGQPHYIARRGHRLTSRARLKAPTESQPNADRGAEARKNAWVIDKSWAWVDKNDVALPGHIRFQKESATPVGNALFASSTAAGRHGFHHHPPRGTPAHLYG